MSRWTDTEAVIADLDHGLWGKDWDKALAEAIIREAPTIDIVRCGECIRWEDGRVDFSNCKLMGIVKADDFCSYGARKGADE